jgi:hypothetical protein
MYFIYTLFKDGLYELRLRNVKWKDDKLTMKW